MTHKERILHSVLFEGLALIIVTFVGSLLTGQGAVDMGILGFILSIIALVWNYLYNWMFDHLVPGERIHRNKKTRVVHGLGFEFGMLVLSFPVIMWMLALDFWSVLWMDIGFATFFVIYGIAFNYYYDVARYRLTANIRE